MDDAIGAIELGPLAIGCARLTMSPWRPAEPVAIATIHAALGSGVRYLDTANCYSDSVAAVGLNEELVARALRSWEGPADEVLVGTKGGRWRPGDGTWVEDGRPENISAACDASLRSLRVDAIGLYFLHAPDPSVPFEDSVGALAELAQAGKVRHVGLSNVSVDQVAQAESIVEVAAIQNALNLCCSAQDLEIVARCEADGRPFFGWGPLRGVHDDDMAREGQPAAVLAAERLGVTVRQLALAWCRASGTTVIPVAGPTSPAEVEELAAATIELPPDLRIGPTAIGPSRHDERS